MLAGTHYSIIHLSLSLFFGVAHVSHRGVLISPLVSSLHESYIMELLPVELREGIFTHMVAD
jgi:hypothetical protein